MSANLQVAKVAELALGKIGAFTVNMLAPDPSEVTRSIEWLDIIVAELAGDNRCFWLTPATTVSVLSANVASYTLSALLGVDYPADGILFPVAAYIRDSSGIDTPVELVSRDKYETFDNKVDAGTPEFVYIDRLTSTSTISFYPVPADGTLSLRLVFQTYAPDLTGGSPIGGGNIAHGFSNEWNYWLITRLAGTVGDGPVRRLPMQEVVAMRNDAEASFIKLLGYANREKDNTPKRTEAAF